MAPIKFILVGGFLGAGKTTLLGQAARRLSARGLRVGLITNDQAGGLVDTHTLRWQGFGVGEVAGGCFCCKYDDLLRSARQIVEQHRPDILLGEPVGSCTDLVATVLRPMQQACEEFTVAPFTVLADAARVRQLLSGQARDLFPDSVLYIYSKQLEEADAILLSKADLLTPAELRGAREQVSRGYPHAELRTLSAHTGDGVEEWLDWVMQPRPAGTRLMPVDYDLYAAGEAELGWLNARVDLHAERGADWPVVGRRLMLRLRDSLAGIRAEIAHLKIFITAVGGAVAANLTSSGGEPFVLSHGQIDTSSKTAELVVNARVRLAPELLRSEVEKALQDATTPAVAHIRTLESFRPGRPTPTHRITTA